MVRLKVGERTVEVGAFSLGEWRTLKRDFGCDSLEALDLADPDHLVGVLFLLLKRDDAAVTLDEVEAIRDVEVLAGDPPASPPPSSAVGDGDGADGGNSGTTPADSGVPAT